MEHSAVIVAPDGNGSLVGYAHCLSAAVPAHLVVAKGCPGSFGRRVLSADALRGLRDDARAVRDLRALETPLLHFASHHLARYGPLAGKPYVVTVHDLMRHRDRVERRRRPPLIHDPTVLDRLHLRLDTAGLRRADALIAVSDHTRRELIRLAGMRPERVHVVPEGVDCRVFHPVSARLLDDPYVLYVGSEQPRKNLATLFRAFMRVRDACPGLKLVKVGAEGGPEAPFRQATLEHARAAGALPHLVFAGRVPRVDLIAWYSGALCLVQPSLHEGFGLPPLEAMACGCPVIASAGGALPEVVGEAGLVYGRPTDVDALAWALMGLLSSDAERAELARAGRERAAGMSWERTAELTRAVWQRVLEGPRPAGRTLAAAHRSAGRAEGATAPM
jgi:glycosyltransferase involved in cell wall biosynthesis